MGINGHAWNKPLYCPSCGMRIYGTPSIHKCPESLGGAVVAGMHLAMRTAGVRRFENAALELIWRMEQRNQGEWSGMQEPHDADLSSIVITATEEVTAALAAVTALPEHKRVTELEPMVRALSAAYSAASGEAGSCWDAIERTPEWKRYQQAVVQLSLADSYHRSATRRVYDT